MTKYTLTLKHSRMNAVQKELNSKESLSLVAFQQGAGTDDDKEGGPVHLVHVEVEALQHGRCSHVDYDKEDGLVDTECMGWHGMVSFYELMTFDMMVLHIACIFLFWNNMHHL